VACPPSDRMQAGGDCGPGALHIERLRQRLRQGLQHLALSAARDAARDASCTSNPGSCEACIMAWRHACTCRHASSSRSAKQRAAVRGDSCRINRSLSFMATPLVENPMASANASPMSLMFTKWTRERYWHEWRRATSNPRDAKMAFQGSKAPGPQLDDEQPFAPSCTSPACSSSVRG
jgi:hypothetical protein